MFEILKRIGKFITYATYASLILITLSSYAYHSHDISLLIDAILPSGVFLIGFEVISRAFVWIIAGYFETKKSSKKDERKLQEMRNYYTYKRPRKCVKNLFKDMQF
jgi:hypothetical protein